MSFQDLFSKISQDYAKYRPHYPKALFQYLAQLVPTTGTVWDCATGNGQAATVLADYFTKVIATDASANQIAAAPTKDNIFYQVGLAEKTDFPDQSIDLITVGQALHWFDLPKFYTEVQRVLKPQGAIGAWSYDLCQTNDPFLDQLIRKLYADITGPYWPKDRHYIDEKYQTIYFPYQKLATPQFSMNHLWNYEELVGYFHTWSGFRNYQEQNKIDPFTLIAEEFAHHWGDLQQQRHIQWPLYLLAAYRKDYQPR